MAANIDSIVSNDRRFVRMGLAKPKDLTQSEVELIAGLCDGWAEVAEMTEEVSGLSEFGKIAKILLGEPNWQRVLDAARKYSDVERSGNDHGSDVTMADPHIATMSLQGRVESLQRNGQCTPEEAVSQAQEISRGNLRAVKAFADSRSALPLGAMTGGVSPSLAEAAADFVNGTGAVEAQRMAIGGDDRDEYEKAADFIIGR